MIRRAQAEALLKLAEALEECERNEMKFAFYPIGYPNAFGYLEGGALKSGMELRASIHWLYPKSEN